MEYTLIRSARKTLALEIRGEEIIVRAPLGTPKKTADDFVRSHEAWLHKKLSLNREKAKSAAESGKLSEEELRGLAEKAKIYIPQRVARYAPLVGVNYGRITIRSQHSRWGSCSSKGNLNFNCLLMLAPPEVIDSVVVHELCHRKEMNHSPRFYKEVYRVFPEYKKWHQWLKDNGGTLIARLP